MNSRRLYFGVGLLCFALLLFELTLIRVYSATMFYHFAFMAISVAMLGLAAAGLTVHLMSDAFRADAFEIWAPRWVSAFAVSVVVVFWVAFRIPVNAYLPPDQIAGKLTIVYLLSAIPFYLAGLVIAAVFALNPDRIGRLYAWDLAGAGLGAIAILPLMNHAGGEAAGFYIAACGFGAAMLFAGRRRYQMPVLLLVIFLALGITNSQFGWLKIVYSKGMPLKALNIRYNRWNSFSRIMAIPFRPGTDAVYTWCPSPNYPLPVMEHWSLMIDDGAATPVLPFNGNDLAPIDYLKYDLTSMGHRIRGNGNTLIIGSGGGRDVITGLLFGAKHIDAVDINPLIFDAMDGSLKSFDGDLYHHPRVTPIVAEGRAFARRHPGQYDLVQVAMIDTWAATTAGAYSLSENTLYTVEAFETFLNALKSDGVLTFTRFYSYPPQQALRLVSLYLEAAKRMGIEHPENCILVAKYESLASVQFKKQPFSREEIASFKADLKDLGFDLVYAPDARPDKVFRALIEMPDKERYYRDYPFDMRPPTDDRPFFFNLLKMKDFLRVFEIQEGQKFNFYATYTLLLILIISAIATLIVLVLPLALHSGRLLPSGPEQLLLCYFMAIGLSYIIVEVTLLQRFVLLLEHPAYAASGVVAGLLISSGVGSWMWGRTLHENRPRMIIWAFGGLLVMLLYHILAGNRMIQSSLMLPLWAKIPVAMVFLIPLGFAMGFPLPAGISAAGEYGTKTVAWCWALNGAASVVASALAVTLAMSHGFTWALAAAFIGYTAAFGLMWMINARKKEMSAVV